VYYACVYKANLVAYTHSKGPHIRVSCNDTGPRLRRRYTGLSLIVDESLLYAVTRIHILDVGDTMTIPIREISGYLYTTTTTTTTTIIYTTRHSTQSIQLCMDSSTCDTTFN
jgi:hypothetical protein